LTKKREIAWGKLIKLNQSTYSREEGNEWEKDRKNKIPNGKIRQTIAQESIWKALLTSSCISRAVTA
jgi:hypothetical protein